MPFFAGMANKFAEVSTNRGKCKGFADFDMLRETDKKWKRVAAPNWRNTPGRSPEIRGLAKRNGVG